MMLRFQRLDKNRQQTLALLSNGMFYSLGCTRLLLRSFVHIAVSRNPHGEPCRTLAVGLRWRGEARMVSPGTGRGSGTSAAG
jgi:hypothetical protein